jgi:uncharacterized protein (UPF0335 family)
MANEPDTPTLVQLQAMRRDQAAIVEQLEALVRQMSRMADTQVDLVRQIGEIRTTLTEMSGGHRRQPEAVHQVVEALGLRKGEPAERQGEDSRLAALRGLADLAHREEG